MTTNEKVIFFDIDGTLVDFDTTIPESTKKALLLAQQGGHKLIICTGRSIGQLHKELQEIQFDGFVCAAGAYVQCDGKVIDTTPMSAEKLRRIIEYFKEKHLIYALQCVDHIATQQDMYDPLMTLMREGLKINEQQIKSVFPGMELVDEPGTLQEVEKALFYNSSISVEEVRRQLGNDFDVLEMSFLEDGMINGEITQAGINKAYGMDRLLNYLGKKPEDTIAFGDGANDIEMLKFAGTGVAMGNASETVKQSADMVTDRINQDGIYHALEKLGIIC